MDCSKSSSSGIFEAVRCSTLGTEEDLWFPGCNEIVRQRTFAEIYSLIRGIFALNELQDGTFVSTLPGTTHDEKGFVDMKVSIHRSFAPTNQPEERLVCRVSFDHNRSSAVSVLNMSFQFTLIRDFSGSFDSLDDNQLQAMREILKDVLNLQLSLSSHAANDINLR